MEFTVLWFGLFKVILGMLCLGTLYLAIIKHKGKSGIWNFVVISAIIMSFLVAQIKIDGTKSSEFQEKQKRSIQAVKVIPPKVVAKDWRKISTEGISKEDLK